ncbi:MAG: hypothetical protein KGO52_13605 [Nitrospirota bacterium]|nr:hypothetical protein [Nitrospirota bacterium]
MKTLVFSIAMLLSTSVTVATYLSDFSPREREQYFFMTNNNIVRAWPEIRSMLDAGRRARFSEENLYNELQAHLAARVNQLVIEHPEYSGKAEKLRKDGLGEESVLGILRMDIEFDDGLLDIARDEVLKAGVPSGVDAEQVARDRVQAMKREGERQKRHQAIRSTP